MCSSALAPRCGATCHSRQADAPDFERECAGLALGASALLWSHYWSMWRVAGTGLGLAIVRAIAHTHNGEATVGDSPKGGASFRVELPLKPQGNPERSFSDRLAPRPIFLSGRDT